jgi:hypothetical protein
MLMMKRLSIVLNCKNSKVLKVGDLKEQTFREELIDYISKKNHGNKKE